MTQIPIDCPEPPNFRKIRGIRERSGIRFPSTPKGKGFISVFHHRGAGHPSHKSVWLKDVRPADEYGIFWSADCGDWRDSAGNYWGIKDRGNAELGTRGQRLCFFPLTSNASDDWHGYPLSPADDDRDPPPDELILRWETAGVITRTWARRLERGIV